MNMEQTGSAIIQSVREGDKHRDPRAGRVREADPRAGRVREG